MHLSLQGYYIHGEDVTRSRPVLLTQPRAGLPALQFPPHLLAGGAWGYRSSTQGLVRRHFSGQRNWTPILSLLSVQYKLSSSWFPSNIKKGVDNNEDIYVYCLPLSLLYFYFFGDRVACASGCKLLPLPSCW